VFWVGHMKEIIIVAGPNGAGKTSFARNYLVPEVEDIVFVNADEIARELIESGHNPNQVNIAAGRIMLQQIDDLTKSGVEVMFETTLATLIYRRKILLWQSAGYSVALMYLSLPDVESSLRRVARRVANGGHGIPEATVRQRFIRSRHYFENFYKPIVNQWYAWESVEGDFELTEAWDD
jgi:predicted ABC-type ATPase